MIKPTHLVDKVKSYQLNGKAERTQQGRSGPLIKGRLPIIKQWKSILLARLFRMSNRSDNLSFREILPRRWKRSHLTRHEHGRLCRYIRRIIFLLHGVMSDSHSSWSFQIFQRKVGYPSWMTNPWTLALCGLSPTKLKAFLTRVTRWRIAYLTSKSPKRPQRGRSAGYL